MGVCDQPSLGSRVCMLIMLHSCTLQGFFVLWRLAKKRLDCLWGRLLCFKPQLKNSGYMEHCELHITKAGLFQSELFNQAFAPHLSEPFLQDGHKKMWKSKPKHTVHVASGSYGKKGLWHKAKMTGISHLLLRGKSFMSGSFHFNMTRPPGGTVSSICLCTTGLQKVSRAPHYWEMRQL